MLKRSQQYGTGGVYPCKVSHISTLQYDTAKKQYHPFARPSFSDFDLLKSKIGLREASFQDTIELVPLPESAEGRWQHIGNFHFAAIASVMIVIEKEQNKGMLSRGFCFAATR